MLIVGAGGFASEMLELLLQLRSNDKILFFDDIDKLKLELNNKYKVLKTPVEVKQHFKDDSLFCLGIGGVHRRKKLYQKMILLGGNPKTIISPFAHIGKMNVVIQKGVSVATGTVITANVKVGIGCLINLNCTIGHDTVIGSFCELSPGVHISGNCTIGNNCFIGTGAVLLPEINIGKNVIIGAGSVVTKNVADNVTVAGIPAKGINKKAAKN